MTKEDLKGRAKKCFNCNNHKYKGYCTRHFNELMKAESDERNKCSECGEPGGMVKRFRIPICTIDYDGSPEVYYMVIEQCKSCKVIKEE